MKRIFRIVALLIFWTCAAYPQADSAYKLSADISDYPSRLKPLVGWKYHKGDDPKWAASDLNDGQWQKLGSNFDLGKIPAGTFEGIGWFRLHLEVDTALVNKTLALLVTQEGASEIYLDGKLLHQLGTVNSTDPSKEERYSPHTLPFDIRFEQTRKHVLAVRYANARAIQEMKTGDGSQGFEIKIGKLLESIEFSYSNSNMVTGIFMFYFSFFFAISFLHFMLWLYYRPNRSNLYYSIFALAFGFTFVWLTVQQNFLYPDTITFYQKLGSYLPNIYSPALLAMLYTIFYKRILKIFWLWFSVFAIDFILSIFNASSMYLGFAGLFIVIIESLRVIIASIIKKREGAWIIGTGVITTLAFFTTYSIIAAMNGDINFSERGWLGLLIGIAVILATLSIPLSMTVYLAREFAKTSKNLEKKLTEVEELSARAIEQEKEKQHILATQNEMLERKVKERTHQLAEKNKEILDSIHYASRIQKSLLPNEKYISRVLSLLRTKS
jgi:hypothetical protein